MRLTQKQINALWGETGPYSQVQLIIETRILDDSVSRIFCNVEAQINPLTYRIIKQNRSYFKDDEQILQLIDNAQYKGMSYGYVVGAFYHEFTGPEVLDSANRAVEHAKNNIIKIHTFVMDLLGIKTSKNKSGQPSL